MCVVCGKKICTIKSPKLDCFPTADTLVKNGLVKTGSWRSILRSTKMNIRVVVLGEFNNSSCFTSSVTHYAFVEVGLWSLQSF